ncbi:MAG: hypothetical protein ACXAEX_01030 [Promethearchaeota archaeon]
MVKNIRLLTVEQMITGRYGDKGEDIAEALKEAWETETDDYWKKVEVLAQKLQALKSMSKSNKEILAQTHLSFITIFPSPPK